MMPTIAPPSVLSAPQRRCQVLLTLFQPEPIATVEIFSALNGVDDDTAREDITETSLEIQRYHRLAITTCQNGAQARPAFMPDLRHATVYPGLKKRAKAARYRASAV